MAGEGITDSELLRVLLSSANMRVIAIDRSGRYIHQGDPNPNPRGDTPAPAGTNLFERYGDIPGLAEAVRRVFAGETVQTTQSLVGETYVTTFIPRRDATGEVTAA